MNALEKLDARWQSGARVCVGLDTRFDMMPAPFKASIAERSPVYSGFMRFNRAIINSTALRALAYKLNIAFYLQEGTEGYEALIDTFAYIRESFPDILTILDCKAGDIGDTNEAWAKVAFEICEADAMTANPYTGGDAMEVFYRHKDKLIFFLCKTSNKGSGEFLDIHVPTISGYRQHLSYRIADRISHLWNKNQNCGLVVGATYPEEMKETRGMIGELPILAPGIGKQEGDLEKTARAGIVPGKGRLVINESRSLIHASTDPDNFGKVASERLQARTDQINTVLASM